MTDLTSFLIPSAILIFLLGIGLLTFIKYQENRRLRLLKLVDLDKLSGIEFEQYVGKILESRGFDVRFTKASGDLGVDIIASKNGEKIGIQLKRYAGSVGRTAISDVVGSMRHYGFSKCMVITTSHFTRDAKTLAKSTGCQLVDRNELEKWVVKFQSRRR